MQDAIRAAACFLLIAIAPLAITAGFASAQNLSSVSGPTVSADKREIEYRLGWVPANTGSTESFGHRIAYGASLNERTAFKMFANLSDRPGESLRVQNVNAQYLIELSPENARIWQTGIRFDARVSTGPGPDRVGVNWLNQWPLSDRLRARAQFIATRQLGDGARETVDFSFRSSLTWKATDQFDIALLAFTDLGNTDDFGIDDRVQEAGPAISGDLPNGYGWTFGTLFGLTERAPDHDLRFWITKSF